MTKGFLLDFSRREHCPRCGWAFGCNRHLGDKSQWGQVRRDRSADQPSRDRGRVRVLRIYLEGLEPR